jgi:predicted RNA-binding protein
MTVKYSDACGGETIMENVMNLIQKPDELELYGLFDNPVTLTRAHVSEIDFNKGVTFIFQEQEQGNG